MQHKVNREAVLTMLLLCYYLRIHVSIGVLSGEMSIMYYWNHYYRVISSHTVFWFIPNPSGHYFKIIVFPGMFQIQPAKSFQNTCIVCRGRVVTQSVLWESLLINIKEVRKVYIVCMTSILLTFCLLSTDHSNSATSSLT